MDMTAACHREVIELHQFFEDWFNGKHPHEATPFARFADVIADTFYMVHPDGQLLDRTEVLDRVYQGCGQVNKVPVPVQISVSKLSVRPIGDMAIVTYEEWQGRDGTPANGRISTATFRPHKGTPNGVQWLLVHETWKGK